MEDLFIARMAELGGHVKREWVETMHHRADVTCLEDLLKRFISSDIIDSSTPSGLEIDKTYIDEVLDVRVILQINEIIDLEVPTSVRHQKGQGLAINSQYSTFKYILYDGAKTFIGLSKEPISCIPPTARPGFKIALEPPIHILYGVIILCDKNVTHLGGVVSKLSKAYDRYLDLLEEEQKAPPEFKFEPPPIRFLPAPPVQTIEMPIPDDFLPNSDEESQNSELQKDSQSSQNSQNNQNSHPSSSYQPYIKNEGNIQQFPVPQTPPFPIPNPPYYPNMQFPVPPPYFNPYYPQNIQNMQNIQNLQNLQNMQNLQNLQNLQNIQNMQNMQNVQNMQNMQMYGYGGMYNMSENTPPSSFPDSSQNQGLYPKQQMPQLATNFKKDNVPFKFEENSSNSIEKSEQKKIKVPQNNDQKPSIPTEEKHKISSDQNQNNINPKTVVVKQKPAFVIPQHIQQRKKKMMQNSTFVDSDDDEDPMVTAENVKSACFTLKELLEREQFFGKTTEVLTSASVYCLCFNVTDKKYDVQAWLNQESNDEKDAGIPLSVTIDSNSLADFIGLSPEEFLKLDSARRNDLILETEVRIQTLPLPLTLIDHGSEPSGGSGSRYTLVKLPKLSSPKKY